MNILQQWWKVTKEVLSRPNKYFAKMPTKGGFGDPVKFAAISFSMTGIMIALSYLSLDAVLIEGLAAVGIYAAVLMPILGVIGIFFSGVFNYLAAKIFGGKGTYEGSVRVASAVTPLSIVAWIPLVGTAASIYGLVLTIIGLSHIHKISKWRVFGGMAILLIIVFALAFLLGATLAAVGV